MGQGELGAWEGGVEEESPWEGTKAMAGEDGDVKSCPSSLTSAERSQKYLLLGPKRTRQRGSLGDTVGVTRKQSLSCLGVQSSRAREGLGLLLQRGASGQRRG